MNSSVRVPLLDGGGGLTLLETGIAIGGTILPVLPGERAY
jgi:hypothetical protein